VDEEEEEEMAKEEEEEVDEEEEAEVDEDEEVSKTELPITFFCFSLHSFF
jgi:hypothetical protein